MSAQQERYLRFPLARRIEHWVMAGSFTVLAITGLVQRFADVPISEALIPLLGGIELIRVIHRIAAIILMLISVYHVGTLIYSFFVLRREPVILPSLDDVRHAWQSLRYNLRLAKERPKQGFFTFEEKFEYWALVWGTLIMAVTGFFLWNPITAARFLPGQWIPAAKAAHSAEALLAILAIIFWHLYHVLVRHFNRSMYTGYLSHEEMEELHPLALEATREIQINEAQLKRRRNQFIAGYGVVALALLAGIFWFVTAEDTAVASPGIIPDIEGIQVYAPLTPTAFPTSLPVPESVAALQSSWDADVGSLVTESCGSCHNPILLRGNLDLTTYRAALEGGDSGPAVVPSAPGVSLLVVWSTRVDHPAQLGRLDLAIVSQWIQNGAPER